MRLRGGPPCHPFSAGSNPARDIVRGSVRNTYRVLWCGLRLAVRIALHDEDVQIQLAPQPQPCPAKGPGDTLI